MPANFNRNDNPFEILYTKEQIAERVQQLGQSIAEEYDKSSAELVLLGILKGSVIFLADLCRQIHLPCTLDFMGIASYGDETESSGVVKITKDLKKSIEGKHVLIVEDIIDTGLTADYLLKNLKTRKPASVKLCALLHKPSRSQVKVPIDYLGFEVPDKFVVGYGLDIAQKYRNLDYIGFQKQ